MLWKSQQGQRDTGEARNQATRVFLRMMDILLWKARLSGAGAERAGGIPLKPPPHRQHDYGQLWTVVDTVVCRKSGPEAPWNVVLTLKLRTVPGCGAPDEESPV